MELLVPIVNQPTLTSGVGIIISGNAIVSEDGGSDDIEGIAESLQNQIGLLIEQERFKGSLPF